MKKMKFVHLSDTHCLHQNVIMPEEIIDVVFHTGDWCEVKWSHSLKSQEQLEINKRQTEDFLSWIGSLNVKHKVVITGNHELLTDDEITRIGLIHGVTVLNHKAIAIEGFKIYGSPGYRAISEGFGNHGYFRDEGYWDELAEDIDILLTHTPTHKPSLGGHPEFGCNELYGKISKMSNLKYHLCGHIHEASGSYCNGRTQVLNSACNFKPSVHHT